MPASSAPMHRLSQQRARALDKYFTDSKKMQAALMTFLGQRLEQQTAVQAVLLMSRQVANFTQAPCPDTPIFATKGLDVRNAQIISLEIEKLTRIYSVISAVGPGDDVSGSALQAQQFLMNALLRARMFSAQSSHAAKQILREVQPTPHIPPPQTLNPVYHMVCLPATYAHLPFSRLNLQKWPFVTPRRSRVC